MYFVTTFRVRDFTRYDPSFDDNVSSQLSRMTLSLTNKFSLTSFFVRNSPFALISEIFSPINVLIILSPLFVDNTIVDPDVIPSLLISTTLPFVIALAAIDTGFSAFDDVVRMSNSLPLVKLVLSFISIPVPSVISDKSKTIPLPFVILLASIFTAPSSKSKE